MLVFVNCFILRKVAKLVFALHVKIIKQEKIYKKHFFTHKMKKNENIESREIGTNDNDQLQFSIRGYIVKKDHIL